MKLCPKLILEGTRLTGKTELALALNEHPRLVGPRRYRYTSPVVSAEWCGFTNTPWGRGLLNYAPGEEEHALATYESWLRLFECLPCYSWILDRFHLSTIVTQERLAGRAPDLSALEARLLRLGFHLVLCVHAEESFEAARAERLLVTGNPAQYRDLELFLGEQRRFRELAEASSLPRLELDVTAHTTASAADTVASWLEPVGGLAAPDGLL